MPCIFRRAALHKIGLDTETYGNDFCEDEVDLDNSESDAADDLRACLSFLRRNHSEVEIAKMLIASGPLPPLDLLHHAATVCRATDEIRQLVRDKATSTVKRRAGLGSRGGRAN